MVATPEIQYLTRKQIDTGKWDRCIDNASNGLVYGYSFFLDHMANNWDALIINDYEMVMPLPWKSKFGIRYIYQPFLAAQLGIFGEKITPEQIKRFVESIPSSFRLIEFSLNSENLNGIPGKWYIRRSNYILDLNASYDDLQSNYRDNTQRNINKANQAGCTIKKDFDPELVIDLALAQMKSKNKESGENADRFRNLYRLLHEKKMATTYGIFRGEDKLLSSAVFLFSHHRAYYLLVGNHPDGRNIGTSHALIDAFIRNHAGQQMILDFEGSDIPTLAHFYSGFGAKHIIYLALRINRLPFYLRWMK